MKNTIFILFFLLVGTCPCLAEELIPKLKGVVIVSDAKAIKAAGRPGITGVLIEGSNFLAKEKAEAALKSYLGLPLTAEKLAGLQKSLVK